MRRYDVAEIRGAVRLPQGGMRVAASLTRTGVFKYRNADGTTRRELRHPDDVFDATSLASFRAAPVTDLHPTEQVTPENWKTHSVGHVGDDVRAESPFVAASLAIHDADMIGKIERGERSELSLGYSADLIDESGVFNGEPYDCRQKNIVGNHVAIGPKNWGRAGRDVRLRLDADDAEQVTEDEKDKSMKTIRIDGVDYEVGSDLHLAKIQDIHAKELEVPVKALATEKARADAADLKLAEEKKRADTAAADLAAERDPKKLHARVVERARVVDSFRKASTIAQRAEPDEAKRKQRADADEEKVASSSDIDLMKEVVTTLAPDFKPASDDEVRGAFKLVMAKMLASAGDEDDEMTDDAVTDPANEQTPAPVTQTTPGPGPRMDRDSIYDARRGRGARRNDSDNITAEERMRRDNAERSSKPLLSSRDSR